jgi:hypothetical protein
MPSTRSVRAANAALLIASAKTPAATMVFHVFIDSGSVIKPRGSKREFGGE